MSFAHLVRHVIATVEVDYDFFLVAVRFLLSYFDSRSKSRVRAVTLAHGGVHCFALQYR